MKKTLLAALLLWFLSLIAGAAALFLAEFGVPAWVFVLLLGWLLIFGMVWSTDVLNLVIQSRDTSPGMQPNESNHSSH